MCSTVCLIASLGYKCGIQFAWPVFVLRALRMCAIQSHQYPLMWFGPSGLLAWHSDVGDCIMRYYCNVIQFPWAYIHSIQRPLSADYELGCILHHGAQHLHLHLHLHCMVQWCSLGMLCQSSPVGDPHCFIVSVQCCNTDTGKESLFNELRMYVRSSFVSSFVLNQQEWLHVVWEGSGGRGKKW